MRKKIAAILLIFALAVLAPWSRGMYYVYVDEHKVQKWTTQFREETIQSTCPGILPLALYAQCFVPKATAFLEESELGPMGVSLIALAGSEILIAEKKFQQNQNSSGELSEELSLIHLALFTLSRLEVCRERTSLDSEQKETVRSWMVNRGKTYLQKAKLELARMPANLDSTLYQKMLKQYEDSLATYSERISH